jgi:hypothetical protein
VLVRGENDDEIEDFVKMTKDLTLDCRFIELMPFGGNKWVKEKLVTYIEVINRLADKGIILGVYLSIYLSIYLSLYQSISLYQSYIYFSINLLELDKKNELDKHDTTKWYKSIYLSFIYLSMYPSIKKSITNITIDLSIHLSI